MNQLNGHYSPPIRFIDLFCGIGGFRYGLENAARDLKLQSECVFSSDIDKDCQTAYEANFGHRPVGDITQVVAEEVPDHDILLAGFPCQPFSIIGHMKGFEDTRGTLFFDIARILEAKKPNAFVLENVKLLAGHNHGQTLKVILRTLANLGYHTEYRVLNALDFGLPQKRERIWIVGFKNSKSINWPQGGIPMTPLSSILEKNVPDNFYASNRIREKRWSVMLPTSEPTIWHENKSGHISAYPYSCALRAGASYNYLLVDGKRRLTPREMLRLQGFPEKFTIVCSDTQTRKQAGNSLPVNVASQVLSKVLQVLYPSTKGIHSDDELEVQLRLLEPPTPYHEKSKTTNRRKIPAPISPKSAAE
jgi:DNA (cytosine-5)-methyltransferase 1